MFGTNQSQTALFAEEGHRLQTLQDISCCLYVGDMMLRLCAWRDIEFSSQTCLIGRFVATRIHWEAFQETYGIRKFTGVHI